MIEIQPIKPLRTEVCVPGSKSYSHRLLIAAALADGDSVLKNLLNSDDTRHTLTALQMMGIRAEETGEGLLIHGSKGRLTSCSDVIHLGNSGTSMRLLAAVAAIGEGPYQLSGSLRMQERPIQDLLDGLNRLGVKAESLKKNGCPPIQIHGTDPKGGTTTLNCGISSQFLSAILLVAPYTRDGITVEVTEGPVSKPYIDLTVDIMNRLGVVVEREGYNYFTVPGGQIYRSGEYEVEPDCSQAGYFWAAAAITGSRIQVKGIQRSTRQGDVKFIDVLSRMGCRVEETPDGIAVTGGTLSAIEVDMADMPDLVPTLAVTAAFASGTTLIHNIHHLKAKECDRLNATITELGKIGIRAEATDNDRNLIVHGGVCHGGEIETYDDHRIAMSFSLAGLRAPGIKILDEACVQKSFPNYWDVLKGLNQS